MVDYENGSVYSRQLNRQLNTSDAPSGHQMLHLDRQKNGQGPVLNFDAVALKREQRNVFPKTPPQCTARSTFDISIPESARDPHLLQQL